MKLKGDSCMTVIGVPKEIKNSEKRVGLTPAGVEELIKLGHKVYVETGAGQGSGFSDDQYRASGAQIKTDAQAVWTADLVIKVKEPLNSEYRYFREDLTIFTYLHLAANLELTEALIEAKTTAIAYEMVTKNGTFPLLAPMSEVAGRLGGLLGAEILAKQSGKLISGVTGVLPVQAVVLGGGVAGVNAAYYLHGIGADVTVLDNNVARLRELSELFNGQVKTLYSSPSNIEMATLASDIVIGSVLLPGKKAPHLVTEQLVKKMKDGTVLVDIAIDQGGCFETSHPTTHDNPTFVKHGVIHYSVANMPGLVPQTSTLALTNVTLDYVKCLASQSLEKAVQYYPELLPGVSTYKGKLTCAKVGEVFDRTAESLDELI